MTKDLNALYEAQVKNLEETKRNAQQGTPIDSISKTLVGRHVQSLTVYNDSVTAGTVAFVEMGEEPVITLRYDNPIYRKDDNGFHTYKVGVFVGKSFMNHFQLI